MEPTSAAWVLLIGITILLSAVVESAAHHVRLPNVVGYLAIGLLLQFADSRWALLGDPGRAAFALLADLGLVVLLFHVGLHSHLQRLLDKLRPAAIIWIGNISLSGIAGFLVARYWAGLTLPAALIIATALTATSIGVTAGAWASHDALDSTDGDLMLDVAELDDLSAVLLMAIVFALVPAFQQQGTLLSSLVAAGSAFFVKLIAFAAVCYLFARYLEAPLSRFAATRKRAPQRMLTVAGAGFAIAAIAAALGFSLAIGAFFAGLLFSRDPEAVRTESGFDAIRDFFMPFFFVGIGLSVELDSPQGSFMLGAMLLLAGIAGKIAGAALPALLVTSSRGALLLGVSMIPRAEIALVVTYQGLAQGLLSETHYAAMVFMSVASCIIAPWLIAALVPKP